MFDTTDLAYFLLKYVQKQLLKQLLEADREMSLPNVGSRLDPQIIITLERTSVPPSSHIILMGASIYK